MAVGTTDLLERLKIDPEFRDKIPPLTADEYQQLKDNILEAGEVYEPIKVWGMVVVDGHHRLKIIREHPEVKWETRNMNFADRWAAIDWMCRNQLGRRNLTDEQRTFTIGKMYEARKKSSGAPTGNANASKQSAQIGQLVSENDKKKHGVSGDIALELNIGRNTVRRAEKFAKGVDALRQIDEEAANKVLAGKSKLTKAEVADIAKMAPEMRQVAAQAINEDKPLDKPAKEPKSRRMSDEDREMMKRIEAIVEDMYDPNSTPEYTIDWLIDDIRFNADVYADLLASTLKERSYLITEENRDRVIEAINEHVLDRLMKVRDTI